MNTLNLFDVEQVDELSWPQPQDTIDLRSSALTVFTDFTEHKPLVIDGDFEAHEAEKLMVNAHVRLKIVLNSKGDFIGVVSLSAISHRNIVKKVASGIDHDDLVVSDFMEAKADLKAIDYAELKISSVGDVLQTLKTNGKRHCLVVDRKSHSIRGVISTSDLVRTLKLDVDLTLPLSFGNVFDHINK